MDDKIFEKVMSLVSDGYSVEFRPDIYDCMQIRLRKSVFNVARVIDLHTIKHFQSMTIDDAVLRELDILKYEFKCYMEKENPNG